MSNCPVIEAETLRNLYWGEGLTQREIGRRYGISPTPIRSLMRKYKIEVRYQRLSLERSKIEELYNSGLSVAKVAKVCNCSLSVIRERMKEFGIPARKPTEQPHRHERKINIDKNKLKELYVDRQLTSIEVAKILGLTKATVQKRLKEYGLMRTQHDAFAISKRIGKRKYSSPIIGQIRMAGRGYVKTYAPQHYKADKAGYIYEHLFVWEEYHHKKLPEGYIIHHLNGIKDDNRPENLAAMPRTEHAKIHHDEPYKKRIRQLEIENRQLRRALEDGQMIFTFNDN